ncbi:MAG: hypothetical protein COA83_07590 [Methylophaga sp.]|nr:MAG: hypothetical protein COA83_07590 [Methylophaga sp.]
MFILKISRLFLLLMMVLVSGCSDTDDNKDNLNENSLTKEEVEFEAPTEIKWDDLVAEDYQPEKIIAKYQKQIDKYDAEDYSPEAEAFYNKINAELNNAPVNETIHNQQIKLPGFIAPLTQDNGVITEFLLVPYFGACIHVPPPPINQTVLIKVAKNNGIKIDDSFGAFWISGQIRIDNKKTDIGEAGYRIENAVIEVYDE